MYIDTTGYTYYDGGAGQQHTRAPFLILVDPPWTFYGLPHPPPRALVRSVALSQCGQFMMGVAHAYNTRIGISGSFGNDGLPVTVPQHIYDHAELIPDEVLHPYWLAERADPRPLIKWARDHHHEWKGRAAR